jgi:hypothetical protein
VPVRADASVGRDDLGTVRGVDGGDSAPVFKDPEWRQCVADGRVVKESEKGRASSQSSHGLSGDATHVPEV